MLCCVAQGTGVNKDIVVIAEQGTHSAVFMPGGRARWGQPGGTVQVRATPIPPLRFAILTPTFQHFDADFPPFWTRKAIRRFEVEFFACAEHREQGDGSGWL